MKLWAKIRFGKETRNIEASFLVETFFQNFNASNSIEIKGEEAIMEIFFDATPPIQIISAIRHCASFELHYGKVPSEFEGEETFQDSQPIPDLSQPDLQSLSEKTFTVNSDPDKPTKESASYVQEDFSSLPKEFLGFQNRAHSYEEFKDLVIQWLDFSERSLELLKNAIEVCEQTNRCTWSAIEEHYRIKGIEFSPSVKVTVNQSLSRRFKDSSNRLTFLPLVKTIVQFRGFKFSAPSQNAQQVQQQVEPIESHEEESGSKSDAEHYEPSIEFEAHGDKPSVQLQQEDADSPDFAPCPIEMHSIPMNASLKHALQTLDKMRPIHERIEHVLYSMGLNTPDVGEEMRRTILQVTNTAMTCSKDELESVVGPVQRMVFSTFINEFAVKNGADPQSTHLIDFLDELKTIIT